LIPPSSSLLHSIPKVKINLIFLLDSDTDKVHRQQSSIHHIHSLTPQQYLVTTPPDLNNLKFAHGEVEIMGLRSFFCFKVSQKGTKSETAKEFPWNSCEQWQTLKEGYEAEGYAGVVRCPSCKSCIKAYRQITNKDILRFEQEIEGGKGRCTLHLPITFNGEASKKIASPVVQGRFKSSINGQSYDVLKEVFFASIRCVKCQELLHMYDRIIRYDGQDTQNWVLSRKDPKKIDEKTEF
jgi:hypothetical protein